VTEATEQNNEAALTPDTSTQTVVEITAAVVPATPTAVEVSNDQNIPVTQAAVQEPQLASPLEASAVVTEAIPIEAVAVQPIAEVADAPMQEIAVTPVVEAEPKAVEPKPEPEPIPAPIVVDIEKALEQSGLVMVETSSDKAQSWQPEAAVSEEAPRPRRKRPAPVVASDEPLMMVETQK
jgi:ribonuclease E